MVGRIVTAPRSMITSLLLLACLGLAAVIYIVFEGEPHFSGVGQSRTAVAAVSAPAAAVVEHSPQIALDIPPRSAFSEIVARPLFSPSRRPPPPTPEEARVEHGDLALRGVLLAGDRRVALLQRSATGELVRALEGESVGAWQVSGITATEAILEADGGRQVVEIEKGPVTETARNLGRDPDQRPLRLDAEQAGREEPADARFDDEDEQFENELLDPAIAAAAMRKPIDADLYDGQEHLDEELLDPSIAASAKRRPVDTEFDEEEATVDPVSTARGRS